MLTHEEKNYLFTRFKAWLDDRDIAGKPLDLAKNDRLGLRRCWIDMAGDHAGGTMLAQIVYWCILPSKETGKVKLKITKDGSLWLAKSHKEWWEECRLSRSQIDRLLNKFKDEGWIETRVMRFNGSPTTHIRVCLQFYLSWLKAINQPKRFKGK